MTMFIIKSEPSPFPPLPSRPLSHLQLTNNPSSAALVDLLVSSGVSPSKMKMMAFTDSDHSINYNGAERVDISLS